MNEEEEMLRLRLNTAATPLAKLVWDHADDPAFLDIALITTVHDLIAAHGPAGARAILRLALMDIAAHLDRLGIERRPMEVS